MTDIWQCASSADQNGLDLSDGGAERLKVGQTASFSLLSQGAIHKLCVLKAFMTGPSVAYE